MKKKISLIGLAILVGIASFLLLNRTEDSNGRSASPDRLNGADQPETENVLEKPASKTYPPDGWMVDFPAAVQRAQAENKSLLLKFTDSTSCPLCILLQEDVFDTEAFQEYASEELVLVYLDFSTAHDYPEWQMAQKDALASLVGVMGTPTVVLLSSDLEPLLVTGYLEMSAKAYVRHLKEDRPMGTVSPRYLAEFQRGIARIIQALDQIRSS